MSKEIEKLLDRLRDNRVVEFTRVGNRLQIGECCDDWFAIDLDKHELGLLIQYLQQEYESL